MVHWRSRIVNGLGFSSCQSVPTSGVCIHMAATSLTMRCLLWDLETNLLIFQCSFIFALPICPDPAVSCVVSKHNKEDLSADMTKNVCRDDVHDCTPVYQGFTNMTIREENVHDRDPVRQGHVSAFPFTPFAIASESLASQLCLPTALTHGRFASSLSLCLFFFVRTVLTDASTAPPERTQLFSVSSLLQLCHVALL